jgi:hypothetical protein
LRAPLLHEDLGLGAAREALQLKGGRRLSQPPDLPRGHLRRHRPPRGLPPLGGLKRAGGGGSVLGGGFSALFGLA